MQVKGREERAQGVACCAGGVPPYGQRSTPRARRTAQTDAGGSQQLAYSHSIVPGGLLVTSYTTRLTLRTARRSK